jgi:putative membrane protein
MMYPGTGLFWLWWIWPTLIVVGLLVLGLLSYRIGRDRGEHGPVDGPSTARDILQERFARGEIDEEEYRRRSELL